MGYQALYRRYRPARFEDFVGQEAVIKTLRSQIMSGRIAHAYLFCGTRGTGKTSTAKVFARAVNCEHPENGDPCGVCPTCKALAEENSLDILEIDAASNNGVDEIRDLREKVKYPPQTGRYRVYIIDEVHMLSQGAFNALLKRHGFWKCLLDRRAGGKLFLRLLRDAGNGRMAAVRDFHGKCRRFCQSVQIHFVCSLLLPVSCFRKYTKGLCFCQLLQRKRRLPPKHTAHRAASVLAGCPGESVLV